MRHFKFPLWGMFALMASVAVAFAGAVESRKYLGTIETDSPDQRLSVHFDVFEFSTLFKRRQIMLAKLVRTSDGHSEIIGKIPWRAPAQAVLISPELVNIPAPEWSSDSRTFKYWTSRATAHSNEFWWSKEAIAEFLSAAPRAGDAG